MRKPSRVCPVCQRKNCTDPKHKRTGPKPFANAVSGRNRAERKVPNHERRRRHAFVESWIAEHGRWCPGCGAVEYHDDGVKVTITADHITPVSLGGAEDGPLQALCTRCQSRQGFRLRNARGLAKRYSAKPYRMER